jgi:CobQ-like glutamine amidotransferase family enzyme
MSDSAVRLVSVLPDLLGTYGDRGNVLVLAQRLAWRGIACELIEVTVNQRMPVQADLYVLGGGEDEAQVAAIELLRGSSLVTAVERGAHMFGVCAGLQLLGRSFSTSDGSTHVGLGLLDLVTDRMSERAVGDVLCDPDPDLGLPPLTGFENHRGRTTVLEGTRPLGLVRQGVGNGSGDRGEGAWKDRVVATYLHGPVLAQNPSLADLLLTRVLGTSLPPLDDAAHHRLGADRLRAMSARGSAPRQPHEEMPTMFSG